MKVALKFEICACTVAEVFQGCRVTRAKDLTDKFAVISETVCCRVVGNTIVAAHYVLSCCYTPRGGLVYLEYRSKNSAQRRRVAALPAPNRTFAS